MISILEKPPIRSRARSLNIQQYHALLHEGLLSDDVELIEGVIIEKMPKSPLHTFLVDAIKSKLAPLFSKNYWVRQEQPITIGNSEPEPDISVVSGRSADYLTQHPTTAFLVFEVSIHTLQIDLEKANVFAKAGIPHYYVIDLTGKKILYFSEPQEGLYRQMREMKFSEPLIVSPEKENTMFVLLELLPENWESHLKKSDGI